ncbi:MAG: hypothetical protein MJY89_05810 [Bacteroidales bacterium]|nr:hypothetical protein [Bacteroidales bacterium]
MAIKLKILTPEWNREVEADVVFLPGTASPFEVLPGHAPIISTLESGNVRWRVSGSEETLGIKRGFVRVAKDVVTVCVEV